MSDEITVLVNDYGNGRNLVMLYFDPVSGKRVTKSSRTTDPAKAERAAAIWQAELNAGGGHSPSKITWKEFRERFEAERLPGMSRGARENFHAVFNHVERVLNPDRLVKLTTPTISRFASLLRKGEMRETTLAANLRFLKAALRWAERQGMMNKAPEFTMPKQAGGSLAKGRPIVAEEYERMLSVVEKKRPEDAWLWKRFITGLWLSGLRLSEALELSWDYEALFHVDLTGRRPVFVIRAAAQKSRRDEVLALTPDFAEWLEATYPKSERAGKVFGIKGHPKAVGVIVSSIGQAAGVMVNKADGKFASAHDLRRSFGNRWAKKVPTPILQKLMRHANIQTTMSYYVNITAEDIADGLWAAHEQGKNEKGNTYGNTPPEKPHYSRQ